MRHFDNASPLERIKALSAIHDRIRSLGFKTPANEIPTKDLPEILNAYLEDLSHGNSPDRILDRLIGTSDLTHDGRLVVVFGI